MQSLGSSRKTQTGGEGGYGHGIFRGITIKERACRNSELQRSIKKEVEFLELFKKKCEISMALGFWPLNFQGVSQNFAEFSGVKAFFSEISKGKVANLALVWIFSQIA